MILKSTRADFFTHKTIVIKLMMIFLISLISGCSALNIKPWVKPYERQNLADPIMAFSRAPVSDNYLHHVFQAREGARGAEGSAGGGCGCN